MIVCTGFHMLISYCMHLINKLHPLPQNLYSLMQNDIENKQINSKDLTNKYSIISL